MEVVVERPVARDGSVGREGKSARRAIRLGEGV